MTGYELLTHAPLAAALAWATVTDVRARRIPNWLTFGLLLTGLLQGFGPAGWSWPSCASSWWCSSSNTRPGVTGPTVSGVEVGGRSLL